MRVKIEEEKECISMKKRDVYILGSIHMDYNALLDRIPVRGETMVGKDFFLSLGGKGANQAKAFSNMEGEGHFLSAIGEEKLTLSILEELKDLDVSHVRIDKERNTSSAIILQENHDNRIMIFKGADLFISKEEVDSFLSKANENDIFLAQGENDLDLTHYAFKLAKEKKMLTIFNPAPASIEQQKILPYIDILIPNETEYDTLKDLKEFKNIPTLIITLGEQGVKVIQNNQETHIPARKIKVVDTTAAGDTFVGVFTEQLQEEKDIIESARVASIAATLTCTKQGALPSIPSRTEILRIN